MILRTPIQVVYCVMEWSMLDIMPDMQYPSNEKMETSIGNRIIALHGVDGL